MSPLIRSGSSAARGLHAAAGVRESLELLRQREPPTAIFAFNDLMAMGVMRAVQERGLRIPDGVAVIAMLLDRIKGGSSLARVQTFAARLVERASKIGSVPETADV